MSERQEIIDHFTAEFEHNKKWIGIHKADGQPEAAERRRDHCKKLGRWLEWLKGRDEAADGIAFLRGESV